jgi:hypothetical protein
VPPQHDRHAQCVYLTDGGGRADGYSDDGRTDHHRVYSDGRFFNDDRELNPDNHGRANADRHRARRSNRSLGLEVDL